MTLGFLFRIDLFVLDKVFQPLAEWIERLTGMNCYRLACNFLMCGIGLFVVRAIYAVIRWRSGEYGVEYMFFTVLITPLLIYFWKRVYDQADRAARNAEQGSLGVQGPIFGPYLHWRIFCLMVLPIDCLTFSADAWTFMGSVQDVAFTSGLYFMSCTPRPPRHVWSKLHPA